LKIILIAHPFHNTTPQHNINMDAKALEDNIKTLGVIDREYTPIGCLGVGGFGSVYLAQKVMSKHFVWLVDLYIPHVLYSYICLIIG